MYFFIIIINIQIEYLIVNFYKNKNPFFYYVKDFYKNSTFSNIKFIDNLSLDSISNNNNNNIPSVDVLYIFMNSFHS